MSVRNKLFLFFIFLVLSGAKAFSQCNPVIYGQDTVCSGSTAYLYTDNIYTSYSWSNGSVYPYTYAGAGTLTLTTVDAQGCTGNTTITVRTVQPPQISFSTSLFGYTVLCTNTSSNSYSYQWLFGDGATATSFSPSHTYATKGNYTVCLNSSDAFCGSASHCEEVTIGTSTGMPTDSLLFKLYKNTGIVAMNKIVQNPLDSGYLIAAQYDNCGECSNPMLIKTSKNGRVEWTRTLDYLYDIENLCWFDNGYVFTSQNADYSVVKIDPDGNPEWEKYDNVYGSKLLVPFSNNRLGLIVNGDPLQVTVFDQNGNVLSQKSYDLGGFDLRFRGFARSSGNTVILNGEYAYNFVLALPNRHQGINGGFDSRDQVTAKMDSTGAIQWMNGVYVNTDAHDNGEPLQMPAGDFLYPGRFYDVTNSTSYYFLSHFDASGTYINAYQVDSMKGYYSTFLSGSNVVIASRPVDPDYDSLRVLVFDNQFSVAAAKKITAYNATNAIHTYDDRIACGFFYFDNSGFQEIPALYKTHLTANTGCLDNPIAAAIHPLFPYVYAITLPAITPTYSVTDTAAFSLAKIIRDSSVCSSCNVNAAIQLSADTFLCPGESVVLTAPSGYYEYTWSNGSHSQSITVSQPGYYTVQVFDYRGCSARDSVQIARGVQYNPLFVINSPDGFCEGTPYSIHAYDSAFQSIYQILWNTGSTSPFVYPSQSGTFVVTFYDQYGCPTTDSIVVQMDLPVPPFSVSGPVAVCDGDSVLLCASFVDNGSGPYLFSWNQGAFTDSCIYTTGGQYELVLLTGSGGCADTSPVFTVSVQALPDPGLEPQGPLLLCHGEDTLLSADQGFSQYLWSTNETTSSIQVSAAGVYSVTVTDNNGCTASEAVILQMGLLYVPEFTLDSSLGFCAGTTVEITVADSSQQPVAAYVWSSGQTVNSITVNQSGTWSVTLTDADGCSSAGSITLNMHPVAPLVGITGPQDVCDGSTVSLCAQFTGNGSGPYIFSWNNGSNTDSCIAAVAGNYEVILTNSLGCDDTSSIHVVTNHALPVPGIQPSGNVQVCAGSDTVLCAAPGFNQYVWSNGGSGACVTVSTGAFSVVVTDGFGCSGSDSVTVSEIPLPVPGVQPSGSVLVCAGSDTVVCAAAGFNQYQWSNGGTSNCVTVFAGTYTVTVTDGFGCSGSDSIVVVESPLPVPGVQPSGNVLVCTGSDTVLCAASGFSQYLWSDGSTLDCITVVSGLWSVTVTDGFGCTGSESVTVTDDQPAQPSILPDVPPADTLFSSSPSGNQWYEVGVGLIPGAVLTYFIPAHNGLYYVVVTDSGGCSSSPSDTLNFIFSGIYGTLFSNHVIVYPNPATESVLIELNPEVRSFDLMLYDMTGRLVLGRSQVTENPFRLTVRDYASGIYTGIIRTADLKFVFRLDKQ